MFTFDGKEIKTVGDLLEGAKAAYAAGKAHEFRDAFRAVSENADVNLGYVFGKEDESTQNELLKAFFG